MKRSCLAALGAGLAAFAGAAHGQYQSNFEGLSASSAGTILTGQDGFYIPVAGSVDCKAYTYASNGLGLVNNTLGGTQFIAGTRGSTNFARAQRDLAYGTGQWTVEYDVAAIFVGTLPTENNLGSVSTALYPTTPGTAIMLFTWSNVDPVTGQVNDVTKFDMSFVGTTSDHVTAVNVIPIPDPAFQDLDTNRWYRVSFTFDYTTMYLVKATVRALDDAVCTTSTFTPPPATDGWFLNGAPGSGFPTGFRLFGGGGTAASTIAGNTLAIDNIWIRSSATPTPCCVDYNNDTEVDFSDIEGFLGALAAQIPCACQPGADWNSDGEFDFSDIEAFLAAYNGGC